MSSRSRCALAGLLITLALSAGCGWSVETPPPRDGAHWHAHPGSNDRRWGLSRKEYVVIRLPEAKHARWDRETPIPRLTLNLLPDGDLMFKANVWKLETGIPEERRAARAALQQELTRLCADPDLRHEDGTSIIPVMFHADREVPWRTIRNLVPVLRHPDVRTRTIQWAVYRPDPSFARQRTDGVLACTLGPSGARSRGTSAPLVLRFSTTRGEAGTVVRLDVGERRWSYGPQPERFADEEFLHSANESWREVETALRTVSEGHASARIEVEDGEADLWCAYVLTTIDCLLGAGIRDVTLPEADLHLVFEPLEADPAPILEDDPVITPGLALVCLAAILLAFALTWLPRVRTRRRS